MDSEGVRRLTRTKDHSHWREVSVQQDSLEQYLESASRAILAVCRADPKQGYGTRGLHTVPADVKQAHKGLKQEYRWKYKCRK